MSMNRTEDKPRPTGRGVVPPLSSTVASSVLVFSDFFAIVVAGYLSYDSIVVYSINSNYYVSAVLFIALSTLSLMNFGGLYQFETALRPMSHVSYILLAFGVAYLFLLAAAFSLRMSEEFSRIWVMAFAAAAAVLLLGLRFILAAVFSRLIQRDSFKRNLAVIGVGQQLDRLTAAIARNSTVPVRLAGIYAAGDSALPSHPDSGLQGGVDELVRDVRNNLVDDVAIALPWSRDSEIEALVIKLRELPVNVYLVSDLVGFRLRLRNAPDHFGGLPVSELVGKPMSGWDAAIKAAEDYILASLILIAISPVLLLVAVLIKFGSPGPIMFRQNRVGFNNEVFSVLKFRTMYHGEPPAGRTVQAKLGDPRITPLGRILRRWSIDELPQILNVLNGTMSLVGPRPHAIDHNDEFARRTKSYFARHRVKPGITGLAQVKGFRGETDTEEKLEGRVRNDIYYVDNWSPLLDFSILIQTVIVCIVGKNAH